MKLARDVTVGEFVSPICLPYNDDNENYHGNRISADANINEVAVWRAITGRKPANVFQFLGVDVTDSDACNEIYTERGGGVLREKQICAGGTKGKVTNEEIIPWDDSFRSGQLWAKVVRN